MAIGVGLATGAASTTGAASPTPTLTATAATRAASASDTADELFLLAGLAREGNWVMGAALPWLLQQASPAEARAD